MRPAGVAITLSALLPAAPLTASAQTCPAGTELTITENLGDEMIIHCAKPQKGLDAALRLMRKSERGQVIADFFAARKIPVRVDGNRHWTPGSGAAYDRGANAIVLPPAAAERDAVSLAVTIAHEGYHANQAIELEMVPCIEAEQDAFFASFVVYFEMVRSGLPRLRRTDPLFADFSLFAEAIKADALREFDHEVERAYRKRRESILGLGNFLPPLGRLVVGFSLRLSDAVWNLTEDFQTLEEHKWHATYLWNPVPVRRSRAAHTDEKERKHEWIRNRRHAFSQLF
ncbi:MAG: hypothetical protein HY553_21570 [Elusimicrobia bacterium]|nr:hypothetical protein [Elusimicrobiota bacterium]